MSKTTSITLHDVNPKLPSTSSTASSEDFVKSTETRSNYSIFVTALDILNHVLIIALILFIIYFTFIKEVQLHVGLCSLGYVLLMSEGIVFLAGENVLMNFVSRRAKTHLHWILQILGVICIVVGVVVEYRHKTFHFRSTHAILGLASVVIMIVLSVCGYPVFVAGKLRNLIRPVIIKFAHNFLGICSFVIGMASQCYGYKYGWPWGYNIPHVEPVCIIVTALITILSVRSALPTLCRQFTTMLR